MNRIRLPFAAFALFLLAACGSAAPTEPTEPRTPTMRAQFDGDSTTASGADRGGTTIGSGN